MDNRLQVKALRAEINGLVENHENYIGRINHGSVTFDEYSERNMNRAERRALNRRNQMTTKGTVKQHD